VNAAVRTYTKREYLRYLRSPAWRKRREETLKAAGYRCSVCLRFLPGGRHLQVHHRTYDRLGREEARDVMVLCSWCHRRTSRGAA
jgi:hypothetical protein